MSLFRPLSVHGDVFRRASRQWKGCGHPDLEKYYLHKLYPIITNNTNNIKKIKTKPGRTLLHLSTMKYFPSAIFTADIQKYSNVGHTFYCTK